MVEFICIYAIIMTFAEVKMSMKNKHTPDSFMGNFIISVIPLGIISLFIWGLYCGIKTLGGN